MSESVAIEVYENESHDRRKGWIPHKEFPYFLKVNETPCKPLDEIELPSAEWQWATNWKISKMPGVTDADGWEYASRFARFKNQSRAPKSDAMWRKARRRLWTRIMRRETTVKASEVSKVLPKIQLGLSSVHSARMKIEEIMKHAPEAASSDQMRSLVTSVNRNISDILAVLDQAEKNVECETAAAAAANGSSFVKPGTPSRPVGNNGVGNSASTTSNAAAVLKKLRNDVLKEETAIERALDGNSSSAPIAINGSMKSNSFNGSSSTNNKLLSSNAAGSSVASSLRGGTGLTSAQSLRTPARATQAVTASGPVGGRTSSIELRQDLKGMNEIMTGKKAVIKSGSAGAFNPSMFAQSSSAGFGANGPEDGVFVDRSTHELMIEQNLIPVDEMTVMQEIIDDRHTEIQKINKGIAEINDMFTDLSKLVKEQEIEVRHIYDNIEESHTKTKEAFAHIVEANKLQREGQCAIS